MNDSHCAADLLHHGVAVVPVMDESSRTWWEGLLWKAMDSMPEFKVKGRNVQRVLGGFGALGNPSSFHHPTVRQFRRKLKRLIVRGIFKEYVRLRFPNDTDEIRLETLFDRLCVRCDYFKEPTPEKWHRDIYDGKQYRLRDLPKSLPRNTQDIIVGGWINMSSNTQHFVGLVRTHNDPVDSDVGGFTTYTPEQIRRFRFNERLAAQANNTYGHTVRTNGSGEIIVPPGHAIFFFQRLVHSVKGGTQPTDPSLRVFHGYRLTTEDVPLFDHEGVLANGAVPRIPSGQMPPMYSQNHYAAFSNPNETRWRNWGRTTFVDACLFRRTTPSGGVYYTPGSLGGVNKAANTGRYMPSLRDMGLWSDAFEYSNEEREALYPQRLFL